MGYSVLFDILGSMIIGGIILLMASQVKNNAVESTFNNSTGVKTQLNVTTLTLSVESDLRRIGYSADYLNPQDPTKSIIIAQSNQIKFLSDYDLNGALDTIEYYLGSKDELVLTSNPDDCFLYKKINNALPVRIADGITKFQFEYYTLNDSLMVPPISNLSLIAGFQLDVSIEPGDSLRGIENLADPYPPMYMRQVRITARNLMNR